jgi:nucleotide-binding universal stress UspA family protein
MFERILVAVDESEHSTKALDMAWELASRFESEVLVLHAREQLPTRGGVVEAHVGEAPIAEDRAGELKERGVNARGQEIKAFHGHVGSRIVDAAADFGADVIVMGSRGLSDVAGMLLGSVSHKVLHLAKCPVLISR